MNNPGLCYSLFIKTSGLCYTEIIHTDLYHRYENIYFLKKKPVLKDSYSKDGYVYLEVMDTYSGIDYPNIGGYAPDHFDTKTGNELVLLLSPVDNN